MILLELTTLQFNQKERLFRKLLMLKHQILKNMKKILHSLNEFSRIVMIFTDIYDKFKLIAYNMIIGGL